MLLPFARSYQRRFEDLVEPHLDAMYRFAFRLTGQQQDAEDLVQDVVVKLYPKLEELASVDRLRPWLNRVLYRQFVDALRRFNRRADVPFSTLDISEDESWLESQPADLPDISEGLDSRKLESLLDKALWTLSPDQRTLIVLHDVDGWSQEDIATVLEVPLGTIKSRIHRCRATLKKRMQESMEMSGNLSGIRGV